MLKIQVKKACLLALNLDSSESTSELDAFLLHSVQT
jgi:hypothetical protein